MQFFLDFPIQKANFEIEHGDKITLIGSCFSDEMALKLKQAGHHVFDNPFGTVFHPSMLALSILSCFEEQVNERVVQRNDLFFSWNASSKLFGYSENELNNKLKVTRELFKQNLLESKVLLVTFGTAWGYELIESQEMVANCHKFPSSKFQKFLSSPYELVQDWTLVLEKLNAVNPQLKIVFTVSPVRHTRDGLVENNLSKSRLIEAVQQLILEENCDYFPSYEILIDVLRDYRFYAEDKVHPSQEAIDFIWNAFESSYFSEFSKTLNLQVLKLRKSLDHKSLFEQGQDFLHHQESTNQKILDLLSAHPKVCW